MEYSEFFERLTEKREFDGSPEHLLLVRLIELSSPMKFDSEFATDEEIDNMIELIEFRQHEENSLRNFNIIVNRIKSTLSNSKGFI